MDSSSQVQTGTEIAEHSKASFSKIHLIANLSKIPQTYVGAAPPLLHILTSLVKF